MNTNPTSRWVRLSPVLMVLALVAALVPTDGALAKTPLRGDHTYEFVGEFDPGRGMLLAWHGTIEGDIDGCIQWWLPGMPVATGQASHYAREVFEIWDDCDADEPMLLLAGVEDGSTTVRHAKNSNWQTNGVVTDAAPEFEEWIGRRTHSEGHFEWVIPGVLPSHGDGSFRAN